MIAVLSHVMTRRVNSVSGQPVPGYESVQLTDVEWSGDEGETLGEVPTGRLLGGELQAMFLHVEPAGGVRVPGHEKLCY